MNNIESTEKLMNSRAVKKALPKHKLLKNTQGAIRLGGQNSAAAATSAGVNCTMGSYSQASYSQGN